MILGLLCVFFCVLLFLLVAFRRYWCSLFSQNWTQLFFLGLIFFCFLGLLKTSFLGLESRMPHDNIHYHYPYFSYLLSSFKHFGQFPLWMPYINFGLPNSVLTSNFYTLLPTKYPFYLAATLGLVENSLQAYKWNLIAHLLFFFVGSFLFLKQTFRSSSTALWGSFLALFSGVSVGTLASEQLAASLIWIPWLLWLGRIAFDQSSVVLGIVFFVFLGQSFTSHYPHLMVYFFTCLLMAQFFAAPCYSKEILKQLPPKFWLFVLAGGGLTFVMMSILLVDYYEYSALLTSPQRGFHLTVDVGDQVFRYGASLSPSSLYGFLIPWNWMTTQNPQAQFFVDRVSYFLGHGAFLMALGGMWIDARSGKWTGHLFLLFILLLALGELTGVYGLLWKYVPLTQIQRHPTHLGPYLGLGLIYFSCRGFERLHHFFQRPCRKRYLGVWWLWVGFCIFDLMALSHYLVGRLSSDRREIPAEILHLKPPVVFSSAALPLKQRDGYWQSLSPLSQLLGTQEGVTAYRESPKDSHTYQFLPGVEVGGVRESFGTLAINLKAETHSIGRFYFAMPARWSLKVDGDVALDREQSALHRSIFIPQGESKVELEFKDPLRVFLIALHLTLFMAAMVLLQWKLATPSVLATQVGPEQST